jgi:hypothetical protein
VGRRVHELRGMFTQTDIMVNINNGISGKNGVSSWKVRRNDLETFVHKL